MAASIVAHWSRLATNGRARALAVALACLAPVAPAHADDWGCRVLLCLSDPRGPETEAACVPPIERLWSALRHGAPFPSCDLNSSLTDLPPDVQNLLPPEALNAGQGTGASNAWASGGYCRLDLLHWVGREKDTLGCGASGAINVMVNGTLLTRVWWGVGGMGGHTITEFYGQGSTEKPYDPSAAAQQFLDAINAASNAGGGH